VTAPQPVTDPPTGKDDDRIALQRARIDAGYLLYTQARRGNEVAFRLYEELFGPVAA
jgi:hypothetical protein